MFQDFPLLLPPNACYTVCLYIVRDTTRTQGKCSFNSSKLSSTCTMLWLLSIGLLSARFSHSCANVSPHTTPTSTPIYFIGNSKKVLLEEKTMCFTPHGLLLASSSYIRTIWNTVGALDLLVWLSSGCDGCSRTTGHPLKPPTVVLCRNPRSLRTQEAMSIPKSAEN